MNEADPMGLCSDVNNVYLYSGSCTREHSLAYQAALHAQSSPGGLIGGLRSLANYGAGIGNFFTSTATLGHVHVTAPYCGYGFASDLGYWYGVGATTLLGGGAFGTAEVGIEEPGALAEESFAIDSGDSENFVYRVHGGDAEQWGHSWTTENPLEMDSPRDALGLPKGNAGTYVTKAEVLDTTGVLTRDALPLDETSGGAPELLFPDPENQLQEIWTIELDEPL